MLELQKTVDRILIDQSKPIPLLPPLIERWKSISIEESGQPLVPIGVNHSRKYLFGNDAIYYGERQSSPYDTGELGGSLLIPLVREEVAIRLQRVQDMLPCGLVLLIWDAFRTLEVQQSLFNSYYQKLKVSMPHANEEELISETQRFVSLPSESSSCPSPHNTGGVVDLSLVSVPKTTWSELKQRYFFAQRYDYYYDGHIFQENNGYGELIARNQLTRLIAESGIPLEMGTAFDYVGPKTATNYFEILSRKRRLNALEIVALYNRRILYNTMIRAGFANFPEEWWHFSYGDQMWARQMGKNAIYGAAKLSAENSLFERIQQEHYYNLRELIEYPEEDPGEDPGYVNPVATAHPKALRI